MYRLFVNNFFYSVITYHSLNYRSLDFPMLNVGSTIFIVSVQLLLYTFNKTLQRQTKHFLNWTRIFEAYFVCTGQTCYVLVIINEIFFVVSVF